MTGRTDVGAGSSSDRRGVRAPVRHLPGLRDLRHAAHAWRHPLILGLTVLGVIPWLLYIGWAQLMYDGHAYFAAQAGALYGAPLGSPDAYLYSPAFSQAIEPLRWLGFEGFRPAWRLINLGAMAVLAGPLVGPLIFVHPVSLEFNMGNIHPLLSLAIVAGFRWPATWAFVLLTKVTPGIGLLWFVVRREWRKAAIALGATAAIIAVSFAFAPGDWVAWLTVLGGTQSLPPGSYVFITAPLWTRVLFAAGLVTWGALTDRRWTVLVAAFLALPSVWETGLAMLLGLAWEVRRAPEVRT